MGSASEHTLRQVLYKLDGAGVWDNPDVLQVLAEASSLGAVTSVYTVPAGKVAYLTTLVIDGRNKDANDQAANAEIWDEVENVPIYWSLTLPTGTRDILALSFPVPVKLAAGWQVVVWSSDPDNRAMVSITGYELPE